METLLNRKETGQRERDEKPAMDMTPNEINDRP
jgi:hypothetical protein